MPGKSGTAKPLESDEHDKAPDAISKADKFYEFMMLTEIYDLSQISMSQLKSRALKTLS